MAEADDIELVRPPVIWLTGSRVLRRLKAIKEATIRWGRSVRREWLEGVTKGDKRFRVGLPGDLNAPARLPDSGARHFDLVQPGSCRLNLPRQSFHLQRRVYRISKKVSGGRAAFQPSRGHNLDR